jgi:hypothetical protein
VVLGKNIKDHDCEMILKCLVHVTVRPARRWCQLSFFDIDEGSVIAPGQATTLPLLSKDGDMGPTEKVNIVLVLLVNSEIDDTFKANHATK